MASSTKKASPSRLEALKSAMSSGAGQPREPEDDPMTAPQNEGPDDGGSPTDGDSADSQEAPPAGSDGSVEESADPMGSLQDAQEAIQKALGTADDPEDQKSLSGVLELLSQASTMLEKHYEQESQEGPESEPDGDEDDEGASGQSEGTDYQSDGK